GGVGKAGTKSHHKILVIKGIWPPIGKRGFKRPQAIPSVINTINVSHLEAMLPTLISKGKATQKGEIYAVNLTELGYEKLLAQGAINTPLNITIEEASKKAIEKIKKAGGKVTIKK
ncbi:MAG: uL15 family ribosomal protein, partial [Candidatus Heimdallarchaeaceae archaeon]